MKRIQATTILTAFLALSVLAQDRLVRVDRAPVEQRKENKSLSFYEREVARLLMPSKAHFGVFREPSFTCESSLTYDSAAHVLVYMEAKESIWGATRHATIEWKDVGNNAVRETLRNHPIKYEAPGVSVYTLPVTSQQAQTLEKFWSDAVRNAEKENKDYLILDGTKWQFFIEDQLAKTQIDNHPMAKFVDELMLAVREADSNKKDSLLKSLKAK